MAKKTQKLAQVASVQRPYIRTSLNFTLIPGLPGEMEYPIGPSMTQPGMTIDIETLIRRSSMGQIVMGRQPQYSDRDDLPEFYKMSSIELIEYRLNLANDMETMRQELHDASKALEQKQLDERKKIDEEYEKRKKFVTDNPPPIDQNPTGTVEKP